MRLFSVLKLFLFLVFASGCGRYLPPIPPESLAPSSIEYLSAIGDAEGITFSWKASPSDMQGKKLKQIDGYRILRAAVTESKLITLEPDEIEFTEVEFIPDLHLVELRELQDQAEATGQIVRKVKVNEIKKQFSYRDVGVKPGGVYLYKIIPINQGSVEGLSAHIYRVVFQGVATTVELIPNNASAAKFLS